MIYKANDFEIIPLFSLPVFKVKEKFKLSTNLEKHINQIEMIQSQTNYISQSKKLFEDKKFSPLKKYITKWLNYYAHEILRMVNVKFYITQSWMSETRKNQSHHMHKHRNSIISGVFHLNDEASSLEFLKLDDMFNLEMSYKDTNLYNAKSWLFTPQKNTLILFPSQLIHKVQKNNKSEIRRSISFNTYVEGTLGSESFANQLVLNK